MKKNKQSVRKTKARKASAGRPKRFFRSFSVSVIASFSVSSCVLNPQLLDNVSVATLFQSINLERFSLEGFSWPQRNAAPAVASIDGYVQTVFAQCPQFFPGSQPPIVPATKSLRELCFSSFAVLHNGQAKTPVLVAQRLNRQMLAQGKGIKRTDRFYPEARLPAGERAELVDYQGSSYDRGHMAPAGDMHTLEAMAQSFSLANMVPQNSTHNRGAWSKIENDTRKYVMRAKGDVFVFTGPVYDAKSEIVGAGRIAVPTYIYKLVFDATTGRSWAHWHANSSDTKAGPPISYDEFVQRTGMQLLRAG